VADWNRVRNRIDADLILPQRKAIALNVPSSSSSAHPARSIESLLVAARAGDAQALGELLTSYRKYLAVLARTQLHHHLQGKADPSDLVQEVCLAAHGNLADFRGLTSEEFAAWLRGILSNILAMHVRKFLGTQKRDARLEQQLNQSLADASRCLQDQLAASVTSPSQQFARNEAFLQLAEALESLPEDYRSVIVMRHVEGLAFAEIACRMNRSVDSVEKLWVRGLAKLKQQMTSPETLR